MVRQIRSPLLPLSPPVPFPFRSLAFLLPFPFSSLSFPLYSLPLEVGPLKYSNGVSGSAVSSPGGVWGGAAAEIEFGAF